MYTTIFALLFACGDAEEKQEIPKPSTPEVKAEAKAEPTPPVATKSDDMPEKSDNSANGAEKTTTDIGGTKPTVKKEEKLISTKKVEAAQSKLLKGKVEKMLKSEAKKQGFDSVKGIKLAKQTCSGGTCSAIGQGTAVKTVITYAEGNGISVKQDEGEAKDAIITKIDGDKFSVKYADGTEATVTKDKLGLRKD